MGYQHRISHKPNARRRSKLELSFSYSAAISACEKASRWADALQLFSVMIRAEVRPSVSALKKRSWWNYLCAEVRLLGLWWLFWLTFFGVFCYV